MSFVGNAVTGVQGGDPYTDWNLEVARRWLEGSWAWRGMVPSGHLFFKIS